jgi:hypothetical protein
MCKNQLFISIPSSRTFGASYVFTHNDTSEGQKSQFIHRNVSLLLTKVLQHDFQNE